MKRLLLLLPLFCVGCGISTTYMTEVNVTPVVGSDTYCVQAAVREFKSSWYYQRLQTYSTEPLMVAPGKDSVTMSKEVRNRVVSVKAYVPTKNDERPAGVLVELRRDDDVLNSTRVLLPMRTD